MDTNTCIDLFESTCDELANDKEAQEQINALKKDIAERHNISIKAPLCNLIATFIIGYLKGTEDTLQLIAEDNS